MRRLVLLGLLLIVGAVVALAQEGVPTGFSYQALIFDQGKPAKERSAVLELYLQDAQGEVFYSEHHSGLKTSATGVVTVTVGEGQLLKGALGTVPWERGIWIAGQVDLGNGKVSLGAPVKLQAAPYALFAIATPRVQGTEAGALADTPIFEVKNSAGLQVFGVYEEGVRMTVTDDEALAPEVVSGFVLSSRSQSAGAEDVERERIRVRDGGVRIAVDEELRGVRGGFAVATRSRLPGAETVNRLGLSQGAALFSIDDMEGRGVRGGFAVATRSLLRGEEEEEDDEDDRVERFRIGDGGVRMFVDPASRGVRGGFAVATRLMLRDDSEETQDLFVLSNSQSYFTLPSGGGSGFSFRDRADVRKAIMNVTGSGQFVAKDSDASKVLKPLIAKEATNFSVISIPRTQAGIHVSNVSRWLGLGLEYSVPDPSGASPVFVRDENVVVTVGEGAPFEPMLLKGPDGAEQWGVKYTATVTEDTQNLDASKVKVCLRNFPDKCANMNTVSASTEWLTSNMLEMDRLLGDILDGKLDISEYSKVLRDEFVQHNPYLANQIRLEFTSSLEGFYGVIEGRKIICTNTDLASLRKLSGEHYNVKISLKGEVVDGTLSHTIRKLEIRGE